MGIQVLDKMIFKVHVYNGNILYSNVLILCLTNAVVNTVDIIRAQNMHLQRDKD